MAKLVLNEVKPEDLMAGQNYLLYRDKQEDIQWEWAFGILKVDKSGWVTDDELVRDKPLDWPTKIFETPDGSRIVA